MGKMNNAVLHWAFELNSAAAAAETWGLQGPTFRFGRMWSRIIVMHYFRI
jgi:hypothetical protein